jgi:hypothetical protein
MVLAMRKRSGRGARFTMRRTRPGITDYSAEVPGAPGNHLLPVQFDLTDGYVGIAQRHEFGTGLQRVLLSPIQVKALIAFVTTR